MEHVSTPFLAIISILFVSAYCEQNLCPAGTYLKRSSSCAELCCIPCPHGTFQATANSAERCAICSVACEQREIEVAPCTKVSDIKCQCHNGTYRDKIPHGGCLFHNPCDAGYGVIAAGNYNQDTRCEACVSGTTFSNKASSTEPCKPCTSCPFGYEADEICTNQTDTTCRPQDCGSLTSPLHGNVILTNGTKHNAVATYICDRDHVLHGNVSRTCIAGSWSGCEPICEKTEGCTYTGIIAGFIACGIVIGVLVIVIVYILCKWKRSERNRSGQEGTGQNPSSSYDVDQNVHTQQNRSGQEGTGQNPSSPSDVDQNVHTRQNRSGQEGTGQNPSSSSDVNLNTHTQQNRRGQEVNREEPGSSHDVDQNVDQNVRTQQNRSGQKGTGQNPISSSDVDQNVNRYGQEIDEQNPSSSSNVDQSSHTQQNRNGREVIGQNHSSSSDEDQNVHTQHAYNNLCNDVVPKDQNEDPASDHKTNLPYPASIGPQN